MCIEKGYLIRYSLVENRWATAAVLLDGKLLLITKKTVIVSLNSKDSENWKPTV